MLGCKCASLEEFVLHLHPALGIAAASPDETLFVEDIADSPTLARPQGGSRKCPKNVLYKYIGVDWF
ncbi:hypothetical protein [Galbibacter pacificus]|uniref:Uncharacterized protein n=1 Tax=Galbibacter pacificus TaxID=2996052 RepID=A0ABT6FVA1_9FLAO|nr:hypothetical protein [Galbibacter pacificus]MDG3583893.1 hypothetical protein [Galbibacter pacificus]MDG3587189.1 hypothetical protein [Galbibacter pacificus]